MYTNINAEMARKKISQQELAKKMGKSISCISSKLTGKTAFTVNEAVRLKKILGTDLPLDVLFEEAQ